MDIKHIREEYTKESLDKEDLLLDPFEQFKKWLQEAMTSEVLEPTAFNLSTLGTDGFPTSRVVLLKEVLDQQFVFFTNYSSDKGQEIELTPKVGLNFFWPELQRQVRITGSIMRCDEAYSDDYFYSRPEGSQIGAMASPQSQAIPSRTFLEDKVAEITEKGIISRPIHWGGYAISPMYFEFWQGRPSRLHDRFAYSNQTADSWTLNRLAP